MRDIIGVRQTELALTRGTLFSAEQAHKIGLIDEIVDNQEKALEQARTFIDGFKKIPRKSSVFASVPPRENRRFHILSVVA